jgi:glycosyltransferase involved in cell wall biosynthesis
MIKKIRRPLGKLKRAIKRKLYERNIGKQYKAWLEQAHQTTPGNLDYAITISILLPVYNPPLPFLQECLQSVLNQEARNWELVITNDGSTNPEVNNYLDQFKEQHANDPRIKVLTKPNGGISSAINHSLANSTGQYIGMLDHDDTLDPRCISTFTQVILENKNPDAVYSDEDKIDSKGNHFELYCKPNFSPELLLTQMYLCHFTTFKRDQVNSVGGLRTEMDGAQDFDLALRLLPNLTQQHAKVIHIPLPLYHWRSWSESTAQSIDAKPWAQQAGQRAQQDYLYRNFGGGESTPSSVKGLNEIQPRTQPTKVSVIIPTIGTPNSNNTNTFVADAIKSLKEKEHQTEFEVIAVTTGELPPIPGVDKQVVYTPNPTFNFSEAINFGAQHASSDSEYLLLLNDDTTAESDNPITRMLELNQIEGVGAVGAKLTYPNGNLQHAGIILLPSGPTHPYISKSGKDFGYFGATLTPRNYLAVTAAAMLVNKQLFSELDGLDTAFAKDFNDVDFCLRIHEHNQRIAWTPYAHFTHHEGASLTRKKSDPQEQHLFTERWSNKYPVDPYYSPALNQDLQRIYEAL